MVSGFFVHFTPISATGKPQENQETNEPIFLEGIAAKEVSIIPGNYILNHLEIFNNSSYSIEKVNIGFFTFGYNQKKKRKPTTIRVCLNQEL